MPARKPCGRRGAHHAPLLTLAFTLVTFLGCNDIPDPIEPQVLGLGEPGLSAPVTLIAAGDIASCSSSGDEATAKLLDNLLGTIVTLGDNVYDDGTASEFTNCYHPTWGRHKARTRPSPGNHDYHTPAAAGYYAYFGANAGASGLGYYSFDLGEWHVISLNSNISMSAGSAQERWLRADLAASSKQCTLAYWHHPRFSSGEHGNSSSTQPLWQALYEAGADIVLSSHDHSYERFAPQTPTGAPDASKGIREFIVGTGGRSHYGMGVRKANSEVFNGTTFGVLKFTLDAGTYAWEFVPVAGASFTDKGTGNCVGGTAQTPPSTPNDTMPSDTTTAPPPPASGTTTKLTLEPTDTLRIGPVGATSTLKVRAWAGTKEVSTPVKWWIGSNNVVTLSATRCTAPCSVTVKGKALGTTVVDVHEYVSGSSATRDQTIIKVVSTVVSPPPPDTTTAPPPPTLAQVIVKPESTTLPLGGTAQFVAYGRLSNGDSTAVNATWTATGGTITSSGRYTVGSTVGSYRVVAAATGMADTAAVSAVAPDSPPVPPAPPSGVASCFDAGPPTATVSGRFPVNQTYERGSSTPSGARIDASAGFWSKNATNGDYMVRVGTGSNICWSGGQILGLWDQRTEPWETYHSSNGYTADAPNAVFENIRIQNYGDGAKFLERGVKWTVRRAHMIDIHDDCVETDWMEGGRVEDGLFEGCFTFVATRPRSSVVGIADGRSDTVYVHNNIVWHKGFPTHGAGRFWKIDTYHTPPWGPWHVVTNNIVRMDPGQSDSRYCLNEGGIVKRAANNIIVWTGTGPFPCGGPPPGWTLTRDVNVYYDAVARWKAAHPGL
jgi:Calcineurin-like phosphoesterase